MVVLPPPVRLLPPGPLLPDPLTTRKRHDPRRRGRGRGRPGFDVRLSSSCNGFVRPASSEAVARGEVELEPLLAASWRKTGDLTWEFSIRKGVEFSGGDEFTAKSAAFSISRAAVNASQNGGTGPPLSLPRP
jgi:ABC-type transport system substrate-binding protein